MRWIAIVGVIAIAAFAAGCGSDDSDSDTASAQTDAAAVEEDEAMEKEDAAAEDEAMKKEEEADAMEKEDGATGGEGATVKVIDSQFGQVIADKSGEAFYLFDKETDSESECYGDCAVAWPPVLTDGEPVAGSGADESLLGTTERTDGELQVTYDGHPLYYYVDDSPGTILCHNVPEFGGLWLVVQPDGEAVA